MTLRRKAEASVVFEKDGAKGVAVMERPESGIVRLELAPDAAIAPHSAAFDAYFLVEAGVGEFSQDGEVVTLQAGDCLYSGRGSVHGIVNGGASGLKISVFKIK